MIKEYFNGDDFIKENKALLDSNQYMSSFFYYDAPLLKENNKKNYVFKVYIEDKTLLALKVEPFSLMLLGDRECLKEALIYIKEKDLELTGVFASIDLGDELLKISKGYLNIEFYQEIGMDFMENSEISEPSSDEIEIPTLSDVDELYKCTINFVKDCGLNDEVKRENIVSKINDYRLIRKDNKIASFAKKSPDSAGSIRISTVYTRPEYRNLGLARKCVNYLKNEIIKEEKIATLNVDQANLISYHLYSSLRFKKVFSRGIYLPKK